MSTPKPIHSAFFLLHFTHMNFPIYDVLIIGGGASGLICALECARHGKKVLLLEKEPLLGRKILVSGNGRCNLTNSRVSPEFYHADKNLILKTLASFPYAKCRNYFEQLGVLLREEELGRIFPVTGKATAVVEALKLAATEAGAEILTGKEVVRIKKGKAFSVYLKDQTNFQAKKIVLACGSCAYPQVSGTHAGYELAKQLGHTFVTPRPTLSALQLKESAVARLSGIRAQVRLHLTNNPSVFTEGEIIFSNTGFSGPAALNLSGYISRDLKKGPVPVSVNFFGQVENFDAFFQQRLSLYPHRKPKDFFAGILHESITNLLIDFVGFRKNLPISQQLPGTITRAVQTLQAWPFTVTSLRPWNEAMVAAGGVNLKEINYNTFESLKCPRAFITGELLDVDGKSGGFNLHFAWSSGFIAAQHISEE